MDSTGLGVLVGRLKLVRGQNGSLRIVSSQDRILKVFKITGLDKVFHIYHSVEAASRRDAEGADTSVNRLGLPARVPVTTVTHDPGVTALSTRTGV